MSQFSIQRILTLNRLSQKAWQVQSQSRSRYISVRGVSSALAQKACRDGYSLL